VSGHYNFDELEAKTPQERALVDRYERLTRAVLRLAELREQRGATQEQLAHAMDVSQPFVSKIERNDDWYVSTMSSSSSISSISRFGATIVCLLAFSHLLPVYNPVVTFVASKRLRSTI